MSTVFVVCAALGGTVLVLQFILTMIGLGGDAMDIDIGDVDTDMDVDFDGDVGGGFDGGDLDGDGEIDAHHVGSSWLFGVISFRTVIAALAFFGLAGLGALQAGASQPKALLLAVAAGAGAMYAVYWMYRGLYSLKAEGTAHIEGAVGCHATVYVSIPAEESGAGKIQVNLQSRTMEYLAMTSGEKLPAGTTVLVTDVITPTTLLVEPAHHPERTNHA